MFQNRGIEEYLRDLRRMLLTDRVSAAGATVLGAPSSGLLHRGLLGAQTERCCGARQLQALVRRRRESPR